MERPLIKSSRERKGWKIPSRTDLDQPRERFEKYGSKLKAESECISFELAVLR
jgi:hypothetical protein